MHSVSCFGLTILSDVELPRLPAAGGTPDVTVRRVDLGTDREPLRGVVEATSRGGDEDVMLYWKGLGSARVTRGTEITVYPLPGVSDTLVQQVVQGGAMGVLLHQRGLYTLHASAVSMEGEVVAFVGHKGQGKSTTAAALHSRSHPLVTDDLLAVDVSRAGKILAAPGVPMLKLWDDSVRAGLREDPNALPTFQPGWAKRTRWADASLMKEWLPLRAIYVLDFARGEAEQLTIEPLAPAEALLQVIRHGYTQRLLAGRRSDGAQMRQVARLVREVPVRRLRRPRQLGELSTMAARLEKDLLDTCGSRATKPVETSM